MDIIRGVRDERYKYIRNFMSHVSHSQPSQYKDGKKIVQTMRSLHAAGKLTSLIQQQLQLDRIGRGTPHSSGLSCDGTR